MKNSFKITVISILLILTAIALCCCSTGKKSETGKNNTSVTTPDASLPTEIGGFPENVTVYEDDAMSAVYAALLEGVYTAPEKFTVKVRVLDENGKAVNTLSAGEYEVEYHCEPESETVTHVKGKLTVKPADITPPVIYGTSDKIVELGNTPSYRDGVTVTDNDDESVKISIDASGVDLTKIGTYPLIYTSTDKRGNTATVTVKVMVVEPSGELDGSNSTVCTKEELDALCNKILSEIIKDGMTEREKAEAIFNRVNSIKYVSTEDDPQWIGAAYTALTTGRGDCWNYASASKALLTLAGIPNYDIRREGGTSDHFWQIVYVDGGWYHFDACPTLKKYYIRAFLLTEEEAIAYSNSCPTIPNYFIYDYDSCPYEVVKSRK